MKTPFRTTLRRRPKKTVERLGKNIQRRPLNDAKSGSKKGSADTSSEVMRRIAAPMAGGMISSTVLTLAVIPAIYGLVKQWRLIRGIEH